MVNLSTLLNAMPTGVWETIIGFFTSFITNYGLAIIVFTICLKIVLLPLDFWQRSVNRKNTLKMESIRPQEEALQKKYANNSALLNQKRMELYKKENYNVYGSCGIMLLYFFVTLMVFVTLFNSLNNISYYKISQEYETLRTEYVVKYDEKLDENIYDNNIYTSIEDYATNYAQSEVVVKYDEIRESFLTIKNIYRPDTYVSVFPSYADYIALSGTKYENFTAEKPYVALDGTSYSYDEADKDTSINAIKTAFEQDYNTITKKINEKYSGTWNGYFGLVVLVGVASFLSQKLAMLGTKKKDKHGNTVSVNQNQMGFLTFLLPVIMIIFTWGYSSLFALYILTSTVVTCLFNYLINLILNKMDEKKAEKISQTQTVEYSRNRKR